MFVVLSCRIRPIWVAVGRRRPRIWVGDRPEPHKTTGTQCPSHKKLLGTVIPALLTSQWDVTGGRPSVLGCVSPCQCVCWVCIPATRDTGFRVDHYQLCHYRWCHYRPRPCHCRSRPCHYRSFGCVTINVSLPLHSRSCTCHNAKPRKGDIIARCARYARYGFYRIWDHI